MELKPISEMSDEEVIEELKKLRARREAKGMMKDRGRIKTAEGGSSKRRGPRVETLDESLEDAFDEALDELPEELEDA